MSITLRVRLSVPATDAPCFKEQKDRTFEPQALGNTQCHYGQVIVYIKCAALEFFKTVTY